MHYGFRFLLAVLAVWRLTHLLSKEDGPWDLLRRFRVQLGNGLWGDLFSCFYCLSIWVALPFAFFLGVSLPEELVGWWAISGGAAILERLSREPLEFKFKDEGDELLRRDKRRALDDQPERYR
jgi:hypothetical protein